MTTSRGRRICTSCVSGLLVISAWAVVALLVGCSGPTGQSKTSLDQLHLLVTSVALNLDDKPGPDGVGVRLYASRRERAEGIPIAGGTLDILMFDGKVSAEQIQSLSPRHVWSYPAAKLKPQIQKTTIGVSYRFTALWGDDKPAGDRVTLVARHTAADGKILYSAPSSIPVSAK